MKYILAGLLPDVNYVLSTMNKNDSDDTQAFLWMSDTYDMLNLLCSIAGNYEYIILAFTNDKIKQIVYDALLKTVDDNKIIDFYMYYNALSPLMLCDKRMQYPMIDHYDGFILGISHSEYGIIPSSLKYKMASLSVGSQDLYYDLKAFEYCYEKYYEKVKNIKYLIIDMFDYTYFNFDTSLVKGAALYYAFGGFNLDAHNFSLNKNYAYDFDFLINACNVRRFNTLTDEKITVCKALFHDIYEKNDYIDWFDKFGIRERTRPFTKSIKNLETLNNRSIVMHKFENTMAENEQHFVNILKLAYEINPEIKIYAVIIPRYKEAYDYLYERLSKWKDYFYTQIENANKIYPFQFYDFSEHEISAHAEYYDDDSHFNYQGALVFTKYINDLFFE